MLNAEYIETLKKLSKKKTWGEQSAADGDDFMNAADYSGGNFDDAYAGGFRDGEIEMARQILNELKIAD